MDHWTRRGQQPSEIFYPSRPVLILDLQTEGGVVPAGVFHTSLSVFVRTLHLQAEQPLAGAAVRHDAVRTGCQPGPAGVDEQTTVLNRDGAAQGGALQFLQDDIVVTVAVVLLIKFGVSSV